MDWWMEQRRKLGKISRKPLTIFAWVGEGKFFRSSGSFSVKILTSPFASRGKTLPIARVFWPMC
jgi:hypothetical protein